MISSVDYTLGDNVENLTLTGTAANGIGNELGNTIVGNQKDNNLDGADGNDHLLGGAGNDLLTGGEGTNDLHGEANVDTLIGGTGNDLLDGGTDADTMVGGKGNDTYIVDNVGDSVSEGNNQGIDTVQSSVTWTLGNNVENLTLTGAGDVSGTGNSMANTIVGNAGANVINGGTGNDTLTGGDGHDTFVFSTTPNNASNVDHITDCLHGRRSLQPQPLGVRGDLGRGAHRRRVPCRGFGHRSGSAHHL